MYDLNLAYSAISKLEIALSRALWVEAVEHVERLAVDAHHNYENHKDEDCQYKYCMTTPLERFTVDSDALRISEQYVCNDMITKFRQWFKECNIAHGWVDGDLPRIAFMRTCFCSIVAKEPPDPEKCYEIFVAFRIYIPQA